MSGWVSVQAMNSASYLATVAEFTSKPIRTGPVEGSSDGFWGDEAVVDSWAIGSISSGSESAETLIRQQMRSGYIWVQRRSQCRLLD